MTQKIKYLAALIIIGFSSLIIIQSIYSKKEYTRQSQEFQKDINRALEESLEVLQREKVDTILQLFERDLRDTNVVKIEYLLQDTSGAKVEISDPKTGIVSLIINYGKSKSNDTLSEAKIFEKIRQNGIGLIDPDVDGDGVYWHDPLIKRVDEYEDSLKFSEEKLKMVLDKELENRLIYSSYQIKKLHKDSSLTNLDTNSIRTEKMQFDLNDDDVYVAAVFEQPFLDIVRRSWLILSTSLLVILIMIFGFYALFRIINKQKKLSQLKDDFMDNVTHELLTPISTMSIAIESLQQPNALKDGQKAEKYLGIAQMELDRVSDIVHNVLLTSSHEKGDIDLRLEKLQLYPLLMDLMHYHNIRSEKEVEIKLDCQRNTTFILDKQHFTNIINNLLDNAIKYCECDKSILLLKAKVDQAGLEISLKDNGPGIPKYEQEKIFEKFHRTNSGNEKGLGIGLYYVKNILKQMNGSIEVVESSSSGTTFKINISNSQ